MKRFWKHVLGAVVTTGGLTLCAPACVHTDSSSFFLNTVLAPPQGSSTGCVYTNDPTQAAYSWGVLDVEAVQAFSKAYYAEFLAGNQLIPQGNQEQLQTESSRIIIQKAIVSVTYADGSAIPGGTGSYTINATGEIDPSSSDTPGYGPVNIEIVDPTTVDALRAALVHPFDRVWILTTTKAIGQTLGNDTLESNEFPFPIIACRGCLIGYDTNLDMTPQPNCYGPAPTTTATETPCFYGQDVGFDCHLCSDTLPFCECASSSCNATGGETDAGK